MMFNHQAVRGQTNFKGLNNCLIYIHIGDSNQGGPIVEDVGFDPKYQSSDKVKIYYKSNRLITDNGEWQYYSTRLTPIINRYPGVGVMDGSSLGVGPDQAFVYALSQDTTIKKIKRYVKVAIGGSTLTPKSGLDNDWSQISGETSELFIVFTNYFTRVGLGKLKDSDGIRNPKFAGVVIRLGTNDCATGQWNQATFLAAVPAFCAAIRAYLAAPTMPIYWVQVRSDLGSASGFDATAVSQCRTILSDCQAGGATPISGFTLLNYDADSIQGDGVHFDIPAFLRQGEEEAETLIALGE